MGNPETKSYQIGVNLGLICVGLGVFEVKRFENQWYKERRKHNTSAPTAATSSTCVITGEACCVAEVKIAFPACFLS